MHPPPRPLKTPHNSRHSPAPGSKQRKRAQCPRHCGVAHEVHEGRVCKLVVAHHVQHVTHVVAAAQQHQGPRDTQVYEAAARVCLPLSFGFIGL
jgi:hypothetical protein